jgi:hypothetical protein
MDNVIGDPEHASMVHIFSLGYASTDDSITTTTHSKNDG